MRHRGLCKLCRVVLESKENKLVTCACGEISIDTTKGAIRYIARDWDNFLKIDDEGNEIILKVVDDISSLKPDPEGISTSKKDDHLFSLKVIIENLEGLPPQGLAANVTNYDLLSIVRVLDSIFRAN